MRNSPDTEIRYDCATRRFAVIIDGEVIAMAWHYSDAKACRLGWLWVSAWLDGQHNEPSGVGAAVTEIHQEGIDLCQNSPTHNGMP